MRNYSILISIILFMGLLFSCDSGKEVEAYFGDMMEIHHKDMVIWGEIPVLKKTIQKELEGLEAKRMEGPVDTLRMQALEGTLQSLESANDAMNDWMHQFSKPDQSTPTEEALAYLAEQKKAMEEMGKEVSDAVIGAKELIKKAN